MFAVVINEGAYQTRATFKLWARVVYEGTWEAELPDRSFEPPDDNAICVVSHVSGLTASVLTNNM